MLNFLYGCIIKQIKIHNSYKIDVVEDEAEKNLKISPIWKFPKEGPVSISILLVGEFKAISEWYFKKKLKCKT